MDDFLPRPPDEDTIDGECHTSLKRETRLPISGASNCAVGSSTPLAAPAAEATSLDTMASATCDSDSQPDSLDCYAPAVPGHCNRWAVLSSAAHTFPAPSGDTLAPAAAAPVLDSLGEQGEVISRVPRTSGSSTLGALEAGASASHPTDGRTTTPVADRSPDFIRELSDLSPDFIKAMRELIDMPPEFEATLLDIDKAEKRSSARRSGVGKKVEALP